MTWVNPQPTKLNTNVARKIRIPNPSVPLTGARMRDDLKLEKKKTDMWQVRRKPDPWHICKNGRPESRVQKKNNKQDRITGGKSLRLQKTPERCGSSLINIKMGRTINHHSIKN